MNLYYKNNRKKYNSRAVVWTSTRRFMMANPGSGGGYGGAGGATAATTRISVIDPHIVQMMRDVMAGEDTAERLRSNAGCGGGGGGGGGAEDGTAAQGNDGAEGESAIRAICSNNGVTGAAGSGGRGASPYDGGAGGGGAGGNGGALVIVTTTLEGTAGGTLTITGGDGGTRGSNWAGSPTDANDGAVGLKVYIQV